MKRESKIHLGLVKPAIVRTGWDKSGKKLALKVSGFDQTLIMNKTNLQRLATITGENDAEKWVGARFVMYQDHTDYQGQYVPCIRCRKAPAPVAAVSADAPAGDDAANF